MIEPKPIRTHVNRPPASRVWEHEHRWGVQLGDSTPLSVIRIDGGEMRIRYGAEALAVRAALVPILAEMVAAAAEWTDAPADLPVPSAGEEERRG